jgi:hypothetical protein
LAEAQNSFIKNEIKKVFYHKTAKQNIIKYCISLRADMNMFDSKNELISRATIPFRSKTYTSALIEKSRIKKNIENAMLEHSEKVESFLYITD